MATAMNTAINANIEVRISNAIASTAAVVISRTIIMPLSARCLASQVSGRTYRGHNRGPCDVRHRSAVLRHYAAMPAFAKSLRME